MEEFEVKTCHLFLFLRIISHFIGLYIYIFLESVNHIKVSSSLLWLFMTRFWTTNRLIKGRYDWISCANVSRFFLDRNPSTLAFLAYVSHWTKLASLPQAELFPSEDVEFFALEAKLAWGKRRSTTLTQLPPLWIRLNLLPTESMM